MPLIDFHTHRPTAEGVVTPRCFGIHPWDATDGLDTKYFKIRTEQAEIIGECGLDRYCSTPWNIQMRTFEQQVEIAEQMDKPVVVHCVRAFNELVGIRKRHGKTPWVVHGFAGSRQLCSQLMCHGIEVSFGAAILDPRRTKVRDTLAATDPYRLFLETDDSNANIKEIYDTAAELLNCDTEKLKDAIFAHYRRLLDVSAHS